MSNSQDRGHSGARGTRTMPSGSRGPGVPPAPVHAVCLSQVVATRSSVLRFLLKVTEPMCFRVLVTFHRRSEWRRSPWDMRARSHTPPLTRSRLPGRVPLSQTRVTTASGLSELVWGWRPGACHATSRACFQAQGDSGSSHAEDAARRGDRGITQQSLRRAPLPSQCQGGART